MDWLLRDLAATVPTIRHIVVLSADGLCMARHSTERDSAERIAAAASGIKSLAQSIAAELPPEDPEADGRGEDVRVIIMELAGGFFYLMSAGEKSYLAVTAGPEVDPGLVSNRMRDLVLRIGEHLSSAPRAHERAAP
ncbi:roadblock/LC7 domain-containing protein [Streptomyces sp. 6N223]|uniref:roadblock/LC7 domain-containing protein n=1 Tax=Streptomyces sp. 6N223 TaxID=3457412 RepID=UPI003FCFEF59